MEGPPSAQPLPFAIPDYELVREIGSGAFGVVWLARRPLTGVFKAVKFVKSDTAPGRNAEEGNTTERGELEGLRFYERISSSCPGLVTILHIGHLVESKCLYYIMEAADDFTSKTPVDRQVFSPEAYVPTTLQRLREAEVRLPLLKCVEIGIALANALAELHAQGIVHRDIKPENIIFVNGRPKFVDIGLIATQGRGTVVGVPGFIAPEGSGSPEADLYALGKVLYELVTGYDRLRFPSFPNELARGGEAEMFRHINTILCKACQNAPERRYRNAVAFRQALQKTTRPAVRDFELVRQIGNPDAAIWLAKRTISDQFTAIKFIDRPVKQSSEEPPETADPRYPLDLLQAYERVAARTGRFVEIRYISRDEQLDLLYCVMELADSAATGGKVDTPAGMRDNYLPDTIEERRKKSGRFNLSDSIEIGISLCDGLAQLHREGMLHGQIYGENIVFVKGVAKFSSVDLFLGMASDEHPTATTAGDEKPRLDQGHDIYALGKTLYEMVSGYDFSKFPNFPEELETGSRRKLFRKVRAILRKACHEDPIRRYDLAENLGQALRALVRPKLPVARSLAYGATPAVAMFGFFYWNYIKPIPFPHADVTIAVGHPNAVVSIDEVQQKDTTHNDGKVTLPIVEGQHDIEVTLPGWTPQKQTLTFKRGEKKEVVFPFNTVDVSFQFDITDVVIKGSGGEQQTSSNKATLKSVQIGDLECEFSSKKLHRPVLAHFKITAESSREPIKIDLNVPKRGEPWTNSLQMEFVRVDSLPDVLFSQWETRRSDFEAFLKSISPEDHHELFKAVIKARRLQKWNMQEDPTLSEGQAGNTPVVYVPKSVAERFCSWLTEKETNEGLLHAMRYRLPSDAEWSAAADFPKEKGSTPAKRDSSEQPVYPWADNESPRTFGNYADQGYAALVKGKHAHFDYTDPHPKLAPVGSYKANKFGIFDLSGNVWEFCKDEYGEGAPRDVARGGSFGEGDLKNLNLKARNPVEPNFAEANYGFRCVLEFLDQKGAED